jgi:ligand-binding sensor domain-containing protein/signal transduction histidine kinase
VSNIRLGPAFAAAFCFAFMLTYAGGSVSAQQLSIHRYSISDGLPHSSVHCIHQDQKGYLWIGTREGLSRFDGYRFTNYSARDGLGHPFVNAVAEDAQGRIWVGTNGAGVARLLDEPQPRLVQVSAAAQPRQRFRNFLVGTSPESNRVNAIAIDADDNIWCATDAGLYRAALGSHLDLQFQVVVPHEPVALGMTAFSDSRGRLWFGIVNELIEVVQGRVNVYGAGDEVGRFAIAGVAEDREGRLFVANSRDVFEFIAPGDLASRGTWQRLPVLDRTHGFGLTNSVTASPFHSAAGTFELGIHALAADSTGALWIGTERGLIKRKDGRQSFYTQAEGLSNNIIMALHEDRDGNLWVGTAGGGICKLKGELIVSYKETEGMPDDDVTKVIQSRTGRIYASTAHAGVAEIRETRAIPVPKSQGPPFGTAGLRVLQDRRGDWWIGTDQGLYRFDGPELELGHGKKLTKENGLPETGVYWIFEDSAGNVWASLVDHGLYYLDPAGDGRHFQRLPLGVDSPFSSISCGSNDGSGALWLGKWGAFGKLIAGRIVLLQRSEGLPETDPRALFLDSRGWLWVGLRYKGVSVTKDPTALQPTFANYSSESGLASGTVWSIAEDDLGRIYLGTGKGLDRLDLSTGAIRHFSTDDGLAGDEVRDCIKDHDGRIWVGTASGLSRLDPHVERTVTRPAPIFLSRVQLAGEDLLLPETGTGSVQDLVLSPSRNSLLIEYVGLDFSGEHTLRYQYRLEGADRDWGPPTDQRTVNYASLSPGRYRFLVRALNAQGIPSESPATLSFTILPPIWERWWSMTLAALLVCSAGYYLYRYRIARLLELEKVRTRIATDLHDDLGSSLSRMAILSEVVRRQVGSTAQDSLPVLTEIADSARGLMGSMRDIVWAIDPRRDDLSSLVSRIRQFASDVFEAKYIKWVFQVPSETAKVKLDPELRRHLFLIFKEAITNIARHSACASASLSIAIENRKLKAKISDDGRGFTLAPVEPSSTNGSEGRGLNNMRGRAAQLGGSLLIHSSPGLGTTLELTVPL